jgi:uncharacterized protein YndB with AHSA1/START domain
MAKSYTTSFTVAQTPEQVFAAVTNPRGWWGEGITGVTDKLGGSFIYRHGPIHVSTQTITELVPGKKVVWKISKSHLNFVEKGDEWDGTEVIFDIAKKGAKTQLTITHAGLVPQFQCYEGCSEGWNYYLNDSLKPFIETGVGQPDPKSKAAA